MYTLHDEVSIQCERSSLVRLLLILSLEVVPANDGDRAVGGCARRDVARARRLDDRVVRLGGRGSRVRAARGGVAARVHGDSAGGGARGRARVGRSGGRAVSRTRGRRAGDDRRRLRGGDRRRGGAFVGRVVARAAGASERELREELLLGVDERHGGTGNNSLACALDDVVVEGLHVTRNEDRDGALNAAGYDTLIEGEGNRGGHATNEHLAEQALWRDGLLERPLTLSHRDLLTSVEPLIAGEEKVRVVPGPTDPVFVSVRGWLAVGGYHQHRLNLPTARAAYQ